MIKHIGLQYDPERETPVINKVHHHYVVIPKEIAQLGFDYEQKRALWLDFNKNFHDSASVSSAELHLKLTLDMDEARAALAPHKNLWSIAREGYGLN